MLDVSERRIVDGGKSRPGHNWKKRTRLDRGVSHISTLTERSSTATHAVTQWWADGPLSRRSFEGENMLPAQVAGRRAADQAMFAQLVQSSTLPHGRVLALDAARGLAAILMVQQHLGIWLVDSRRFADQLQAGFMYVNMAGGLAAPLFIVLSGAGASLGWARHAEGAAAVRRGMGLLTYGVLLNLITPSWFSWASFYVLHLLGVWSMFAPLLLPRRTRTLAAVAGACFVLAVLGQTWLETPLKLNNARMRDWSGFLGPLRLMFFESQFPLFPWFALAVGGAWAGRAIVAGNVRQLGWMALGAGMLAGLLRGLVWVEPRAPFVLPWRAIVRTSFFPLSTVYALMLYALCLAVLGGCVLGSRGVGARWLSWLVPFGRTSLSLLVFHVVVFRQGLPALELMGSQSPIAALAVIVLFLFVWYGCARLWSRVDYRYGLEWWLRRFARSSPWLSDSSPNGRATR